MSSLGDAREELYTPTGTQIKAVFDGDGYSGVSVDEMTAKMGKPRFVNKVTDGIYPVTMYTYCKKDFMYEFDVYEGNVVKVTMHPEGEFKVQKIRSYDTFATLGIMPSKDVYVSATALARKKFSEVSNKVFAVDLIISENNKIDMVHIIYDKRFDTPTK